MCYLTTDLRPNDPACAQTDKNIYRPCILSRYFSLALRHFKFYDSVFTQSTDFYADILVSLIPDIWAGKWCITVWIKLSKHTENAAYLRSESKFRYFVRAVYHNKNHVIIHPVSCINVSHNLGHGTIFDKLFQFVGSGCLTVIYNDSKIHVLQQKLRMRTASPIGHYRLF